MSLLETPIPDTPDTRATEIGPEFVIEDGPAAGAFELTQLANRNVVYVWQEQDGPGDDNLEGVYMRIYDTSGNLVLDTMLVNTVTEYGQQFPVVEAVGDGFVVAWEDNSKNNPGNNSQAAGQMFDANGNPVNGEFQIDLVDTHRAEGIDIVGLKGGGFAIVYAENFNDYLTPPQVWVQLYTAAGAEIGGPIEVDGEPGYGQSQPVITALDNGGFAIAYEEFVSNDELDLGIRVTTFDASGAAVGAEVVAPDITTGGQASPAIVALTGGGFVVTWLDASGGAFDALRFVGQLFDSQGAQVGSDFEIHQMESLLPASPAEVAALPGGGFVVVYEDRAEGATRASVYAQEYDANGNAVGGAIEVPDTPGNNQPYINVHGTADGFVVVFVDSSGTDLTVRSQFYQTSGEDPGTPGEIIDGDNGANTLTGTDGDDVINGLGGWDNIHGGDGDDSIFGGGETDRLYGEAGDDFINGNNERDILFGGEGDDTLRGGDGDDVLKGGAGNDRLAGDAGNDHLQGGAGADVLKGGAGRDILSGGAGADVFVYGAVSDSPADADFRDTIQDFESGIDQINLQGIDAISATSADDAFVMVNSFSEAGGELTVKAASMDGVFWLRGDTDGDGHADFEVIVKGDMPTADDILL